MIDADLLILLSDVDGLYTDNPLKNKKAKKIQNIYNIDSSIEKMASKNYSLIGSGGMETKILAAKICMNAGCSTIITNSDKKILLKTLIKIILPYFMQANHQNLIGSNGSSITFIHLEV